MTSDISPYIDWSQPYTIEGVGIPQFPPGLFFKEADTTVCTLLVRQSPDFCVLVKPTSLGRPELTEMRLTNGTVKVYGDSGVFDLLELLTEPVTMTEPVVVVAVPFMGMCRARPDETYSWTGHVNSLEAAGFVPLAKLSRSTLFSLPRARRDEVFVRYVLELLEACGDGDPETVDEVREDNAAALRLAHRAWSFMQTPAVLAELARRLAAAGSVTRAYSALRAAEGYFGEEFVREMEEVDYRREFGL